MALLAESALLFGLIQVMPDAGPHNTALWLLVIPQFPGIVAASVLVLPSRGSLEPLMYKFAYFSVVFVVQATLLVVLSELVTGILTPRLPAEKPEDPTNVVP